VSQTKKKADFRVEENKKKKIPLMRQVLAGGGEKSAANKLGTLASPVQKNLTKKKVKKKRWREEVRERKKRKYLEKVFGPERKKKEKKTLRARRTRGRRNGTKRKSRERVFSSNNCSKQQQPGEKKLGSGDHLGKGHLKSDSAKKRNPK